MRKKLYETRKDYVKWIWTYKKRREKARTNLKAMSRKIKGWEKQIKNMDEKKAKIIALGNAVAMFTGINVKNSNDYVIDGMKEAKSIFYKYGLENGMAGTELEDYVCCRESGQAAKYRRKFNKSFDTIPSNLELFNRFKRYYEAENEEETI